MGAIIFFEKGGHEKAVVSHKFFIKNRGSKNKTKQEIIGGHKFYVKILFNEIAPKCIFPRYASGIVCFFNIVVRGGGGS